MNPFEQLRIDDAAAHRPRPTRASSAGCERSIEAALAPVIQLPNERTQP